MPEGYEKIRDKFIAKGMSADRAKKRAAMIWNGGEGKRTGQTVGRGRE